LGATDVPVVDVGETVVEGVGELTGKRFAVAAGDVGAADPADVGFGDAESHFDDVALVRVPSRLPNTIGAANAECTGAR
jgi:hypothetical protein